MKTIFIGPFGNGRIPDNGASIKNFHILNRLRSVITGLTEIDTDNWKRRPLVLIKILMTVLLNPTGKFILSLNNDSANKLIRLIRMVAPRTKVIYWVVGGSIGKWMQEGKVNPKDYGRLTNIIVEGESMKKQIEECGVHNVSVMPNFKKMIDMEIPVERIGNGIKKFVFLSRINPDKGCNLILEAAERLNACGYGEKYGIDFYGPVEPAYEHEFCGRLSVLGNVVYKGFLDLRDMRNYDCLSSYDAMLFPTFWHGEGCPGIVIDAYICGLPILASDWNLNRDYIQNNVTGILFQPKSVDAVYQAIKDSIDGGIRLDDLRKNAFRARTKYDINTVLSNNNLIKNQILDA